MSPRKIVIGFGRFNPPTTGHAEHIKYIVDTAHRLGADHIIYASASQDRLKNPLPFTIKVNWLHRLFPRVTFNQNQHIRTPFDAFKQCAELGYTHIFVVVSGERVPEFKRFAKYFAPPESPEFKKGVSLPAEYTVVDSGRSMDTGARMSATKMRGFAKDGDLNSFRKGVPTSDSRQAELLFKDVRNYMGIHEALNLTTGQFAMDLFEAQNDVLKEDHVKVGDKVHAGFGTRGGAGFRGVVDKVDDRFVYVNIGKDKYGDRIIKAPHAQVMKEARTPDNIKVGDKVHASFGGRPEAQYDGTVEKIEGTWVFVKIAQGERGAGHTTKIPLRSVRLVNEAVLAMPLKGHPYHKKSDAELLYIIKDAGEAAYAMRGHNPRAEAKYLDQVNDASTVMHYRRQGGKQMTEAETSGTKQPTEVDRIRSTQQQDLIALKQRQANQLMAAKLRDVQMKAREAQMKSTQPKPAAKPAS